MVKIGGGPPPAAPAKHAAVAGPSAPARPIAADAFGGPVITTPAEAKGLTSARVNTGGASGLGVVEAKFVLVALEDGKKAVLLNAATGKAVHVFETGPKPFGAAFSRDGLRAFVTDNDAGTLSAVDVQTGAIVSTLELGEVPRQPQMTTDGRLYVPLWGQGAIVVVDATTTKLEILRTLQVGRGSKPHVLSLSPDEQTLWATVRGRDVRVLSIRLRPGGEEEPREHRYDAVPRVAAATDDGVFFTAHHSLGLHHIRLEDGATSTPYMDVYGEHSDPRCQIEGVATAPNGRLLAIAHEGRRAVVVLRRNDDGTLKKKFEVDNLPGSPYWVTFDPSSTVVFASIPSTGEVHAYDVTLSSRVKRLWAAKVDGTPKRLAATS